MVSLSRRRSNKYFGAYATDPFRTGFVRGLLVEKYFLRLPDRNRSVPNFSPKTITFDSRPIDRFNERVGYGTKIRFATRKCASKKNKKSTVR